MTANWENLLLRNIRNILQMACIEPKNNCYEFRLRQCPNTCSSKCQPNTLIWHLRRQHWNIKYSFIHWCFHTNAIFTLRAYLDNERCTHKSHNLPPFSNRTNVQQLYHMPNNVPHTRREQLCAQIYLIHQIDRRFT